MHRLRRHLTFANTISLIALFFALGGGAYAVTAGKNTVTSKSIVNGAVGSVDVRDNALTGADILERTLKLPQKTIPAARVTFDATQNASVPDGFAAATTVTWNQEIFDTQGLHSGSAATLTPPIAGVYQVSASVELGNGANANNGIDTMYWMWIASNEELIAETQNFTTSSAASNSGSITGYWNDPVDLNASGATTLDAGESVTVSVYQFSGTSQALPLDPGDNQSSFSMVWLGPPSGPANPGVGPGATPPHVTERPVHAGN